LKEFLFEESRPFRSCHASTLLELENGDTLASYFGGTKEGAPDVGIWSSRRVGGKWNAPALLASMPGVPHWNPVLFRAPDGRILLFYKAGEIWFNWKTMIMESKDTGHTWNAPVVLVPGDGDGEGMARGPVKNKPIVLSDGRWLAGSSIERRDGTNDVFVDESSDNGRSWKRSDMVPLDHATFSGPGVIQPTLWESRPGHVHMLVRSTCGRICRSDSADGGRTWARLSLTSLPNNGAGIDLARLKDGTLALAYNPIEKNRGRRNPLVLSLSKDNGATWSRTIILEPEGEEKEEYSYPAVIPHAGGVSITYTWRRERVAYTRVDLQG